MKHFIALSLLIAGCVSIPYNYENSIAGKFAWKSGKPAKYNFDYYKYKKALHKEKYGYKATTETARAQDPDYVDPDYYYEKALNTPMILDDRVKAPRNSSSPSAASALAYMKRLGGDDICGKTTRTFLENILSGNAIEMANAEATKVYIIEYNAGARPEPGSACDASVKAWMAAEKSGRDPIIESALAFMKAHPHVKEGNPCAVSGVTYVSAILEGRSHTEANLEAASSFAEALITKAKNGEELRDPACAESTKAFFTKLEVKPSPPNAAAMLAFIDKAFSSEKFDFDPICWKSTEAFWQAYKNGQDELSANLAAAEVFLEEFAKGSKIPADSPCAAATRAYYENIPNPPSPPNKAAMEAFMDKMIGEGARTPDPVCAISTKAYWKAYKSGATELEANLAAAEAFFDEYVKGSSIPADSPCAASTRAYFKNIENAPSPANKAAMEAFMDKMMSNGKERAQDPICDASTLAYWKAWKEGKGELNSNLAAAEAFLDEFAKGSKVPVDSPCAAATRAYYENIPNPPSPPNKAAMEAFMDKMIGDGARTPDPVCAISTKAFWKAYKNNATELEANLAAAEAFFDEFVKGSTIPADSPCAAATRAYWGAIEKPPSPANKAAMEAFMDKMIGDGNVRAQDPVCAKSTLGYWQAWKEGKGELASNLAAAEAFFDEFAKGSKVPVDSPCAAATRAYYENIPHPPSPPNKAAMEAFMDKMIGDGARTPDPVCAASTRAYWDAYKSGANELDANLAAAESFFNAFEQGLSIPADSPCAAATRAYYDNIPNPPSPPNKAAMVAFMDKMIGTGQRTADPVCAASTLGFWKAYKEGKNELDANLAAAEVFLDAFAEGKNIHPDSPCAAATRAYYANIPNPPSPPNKAAMEAFMDKMIKDGKRTPDPVCAISTKAYWVAYKNGSSEYDANLAAAEAFFAEYVKGSTIPADSPCAAATRAYWEAIPRPPSPANKAAMEAFMDKMIGDGNVRAQDPVCAKSTLAYWQAWKEGKGELDSNLAAAEAFFDEFAKGSKVPVDSPCAAATRAYYKNIPNPPSPPNKAAMEAFMDKMIGDGARTPDPVCAASTRAYWDAYKAGKGEYDSNLAAGEAFLATFEDGFMIPADSPCAASTRAYYNALKNPPSPPNKAAMETFMDKMIGSGKRTRDPACAASLRGYWDAYKSGLSETRSNLAAAEAFLNAYNSGLDVPADSACVAATKSYYMNLEDKPSGPNAEAMIAFIDHMVSNGNKRVYDPVCAASTSAFFEAHKNGDSELTANFKAARAFFSEYKKGAKVPADSACAAATKIYYEQIKNKPSPPNAVGMMAFIEESIKSGINEMDPVCAASAEAYFDAYIQGVGEAKANEAAGVAFLDAVENSQTYSPSSPCGRAADAYMKEFGL